MQSSPTGPRAVIVAYKPKPGWEVRLDELTADHVPLLRKLGFATKMPSIAMRAADGTVVEVFEWEDGGMEKAHEHPLVKELWFQYSECSTYVPLNTLGETTKMFADFTPIGVY